MLSLLFLLITIIVTLVNCDPTTSQPPIESYLSWDLSKPQSFSTSLCAKCKNDAGAKLIATFKQCMQNDPECKKLIDVGIPKSDSSADIDQCLRNVNKYVDEHFNEKVMSAKHLDFGSKCFQDMIKSKDDIIKCDK
ncbi:uncharacterized protein LOC128952461 [Oppia nitens]|uniref:uncharacterized protein LOC128952461 n=1 Tax=Oppia nitens TaxID=1686743 RepID=UPI0023DCB80B|nr:uncharacterized protein LOC128952461 [Oppia nitens]